MTEEVNETIINMVNNLRPKVENNLINFGQPTPLKRPLSSTSNDESQSSLDEPHPSKKIKQVRMLDNNYMGSPREVRRLRADLVEARNTILNLESRVQHMHNIRKEMQLLFENETKDLKKQREHDRKSIEDLETQVQSIRQREVELRDELSKVKHEYNVVKVKKDEKIEELDKSLNEMRENVRAYDGEENEKIAKLKWQISELQTMLDAAQDDAEAQKKLAEELAKQLAEKNAIDRKLDVKEQSLQTARLRIKELEYAKENFLEYQEQAKTQAQKLAHYIELEKENERLKQENVRLKGEVSHKLILEEEVHDLKSRLVKFKENEKTLSHLQIEQVENERHLEEWKIVGRSICETTVSDSSLPHLLRNAVERLQQQEISLTSAKVELESQLTTALYEAKVAQTELAQRQKQCEELKKSTEQKQNLIHRMQKRLMLVNRERDSYRQQLDSYEKDLTTTIDPSATPQSTNSQVQTLKDRIDQLEKLIDSYRELNAKLESDLENATPDKSAVQIEQISQFQTEMEQLKIVNKRLKERVDQLERQLEDQQVGNDTLRGGQVYHMAKNPLAECLEEREQYVEKLQQEVDKLKRKIKKMESGLESSKLSESMLCTQDAQKLKEQVKSQELQNQKLKEHFKSSMHDLRNLFYMLFGYRIDKTANSVYKLTSMYAERQEDQLCFQLNCEGVLNLLENEYSATLEDMVNLHLRHQKSIPVFLSAITIEQFNSQTVTTRAFEIE